MRCFTCIVFIVKVFINKKNEMKHPVTNTSSSLNLQVFTSFLYCY